MTTAILDRARELADMTAATYGSGAEAPVRAALDLLDRAGDDAANAATLTLAARVALLTMLVGERAR